MTTAWREYGDSDLPRILSSALTAFAEHGYHGTSIRDIARDSGLSVPGLYHHYASKQAILAALMAATMDDLIGRSRAALDDAGDDPGARFDAVVESLLRFHMFRRAQAFVGSSEIRSLEPENRAAFVARRDEQQALVREAIESCVAAGVLSTSYPGDVARAISTLCVGVASWFREDGALDPDALVERYLMMARALANAG